MARTRITKRNQNIAKDFFGLKKRHIETSFALEHLSEKYYLSKDYLYKIVRNAKEEKS